jgi:hypothetical protein
MAPTGRMSLRRPYHHPLEWTGQFAGRVMPDNPRLDAAAAARKSGFRLEGRTVPSTDIDVAFRGLAMWATSTSAGAAPGT